MLDSKADKVLLLINVIVACCTNRFGNKSITQYIRDVHNFSFQNLAEDRFDQIYDLKSGPWEKITAVLCY